MASLKLGAENECHRVVSSRFYSEQALRAAQSAFLKHCAVKIEPAGGGLLNVIVKPIGEAVSSGKEAILEFWNFALDTEAQRRLGR